MAKDAISTAARRYRRHSLWLTAALTLAGLVALAVLPMVDLRFPGFANSLVVSVVYAIIASFAYAPAWESVARGSAANLAKFYLVGSLLKMMAALAVFLVGAVAMGKPQAATFALVFAAYYVALLVFDCAFFARIEKKGIFNENKIQ